VTGPIDRAGSFSFNQLNKIVEAYEGKITKSVAKGKEKGAEVKDKVDIGGKFKDVIILPSKELMKAHKNINAEKIAGELKKEGIKVNDKLDVISGVTAKVSPEDLKKLKEQGYLIYDDSVRNLMPDIPKVTSAPSEGGNPWDMPKIEDVKWTGVEKLHEKGITGKDQVVAVVDSGYSHPEKPPVAWVDMVEGSEKPVDPNGHGTHVAGDVIKMAPDADIVAVRVMRADGTGRTSDIVKGLQWVIENKDKYHIGVINMSLGGGPDGYPYYLSPINKAVAEAKRNGITVVVAGGNSGPRPHTIGAPGDSPDVITVGAALNPHKVSDFSSRGPTDDNFAKPDVVAPGEYITSWAVPGSQLDKIATTVETIRRMTPSQLRKLLIAKPDLIKALGLPEDILQKDDKTLEKDVKMALPPIYKPTPDTLAGPGTSFASPEVAGIVADLRQSTGVKNPEKIKEALTKTAENMGEEYTVMDQGSGFVQADKAEAYLYQQNKKA